jgi:hypothetical protein
MMPCTSFSIDEEDQAQAAWANLKLDQIFFAESTPLTLDFENEERGRRGNSPEAWRGPVATNQRD